MTSIPGIKPHGFGYALTASMPGRHLLRDLHTPKKNILGHPVSRIPVPLMHKVVEQQHALSISFRILHQNIQQWVCYQHLYDQAEQNIVVKCFSPILGYATRAATSALSYTIHRYVHLVYWYHVACKKSLIYSTQHCIIC